MSDATPRQQLAGFLARYDPAIASLANAALRKLRTLVPGATELVYDNYNALAIGFASGDRASDAIVSIAAYPRWVSLFFLHGAKLVDPKKLLKGSGSRVRHVVLDSAADLDRPEIVALIRQAVRNAHPPLDSAARARLIVKSVSAKQRPRRRP